MNAVVILAGTFIAAGCTPDGACWPNFWTERAAYVRELPHEMMPHGWRGMCRCGKASAVIIISPGGGYTREALIAHELGHDAGVTVHRDGSIFDWREK